VGQGDLPWTVLADPEGSISIYVRYL